jgi:hypothetical protein
MAKTKTRTWDAAEHLKSEEDMAAYLEAVLEEQDPALFAAALGELWSGKPCPTSPILVELPGNRFQQCLSGRAPGENACYLTLLIARPIV